MAELYLPDASNWIGAFEAGGKARMTRDRQAAQRTAGGLMTSGDYRGAAAAVAPYDLETGAALTNMGAKADEQKRRQSYAQTVAAGQGDEAIKAATAGGDFIIAKELAEAIDGADERQKKKLHDNATRVAEIVAPLGDIPESDMAGRKAYIAQHRADLVGAGYSEEQVDGFVPSNQNLAGVYTHALGFKEYIEKTAPKVVGDALIRTPLLGDKPEVLYEGTKMIPVPEGGKLVPVTGGRVAGGGGVAEPSTATAPPQGGIYDAVAQIAGKAGAKPEEVGYLQRLAQVESHGDPGEQKGRSTGLFQFHPDTFAAVGGHGDIHDVGAQTNAALALSRRDRQNLQQLGIEPTDANVYIMHQQGPGGGRALLTAPPEVSAVAALTPVYGSADMAKRAIVGNGGREDMKAGEFVDMWRQRWAGGGSDRTATAAAPSATSGDPPGTIYGNPKPVKAPPRPATAAEKAAYGVAADVPAQMVDGELKVISGTGAALKPVPVQIQKQMLDARAGMRKIDSALEMVRLHPKAFGMGNIVGNDVTQRLPGEAGAEGMAARAAVANIGSLIIHDRSGAAVTIAETPRLKPFIPMPTDTDRAAATKLHGLRNELAIMATEIEEMYGQDSGYRPMGGSMPADPAATMTPPGKAAPAAKPAASKAAHQMSDAELKAALGLP